MNVSILLRLVTDAVGTGRVAGHAQVVDTGEVALFKDEEEMLAFIHKASAERLASAAPELPPEGSM